MTTINLTDLGVKRDWAALLAQELTKPYLQDLWLFIEREYANWEVYPPRDKIFTALSLTGYAQTKVVILGQDPYHGPHQAHGLCFSVGDKDAKFPPSLRNMFKELAGDLGHERTRRDLRDWAAQGVLLLNTVLTVRAGQAASHRGKGWEKFTDAIIRLLNQRKEPVVFVLWGADAQKKMPLIDQGHHKIIASAHPSPLSAHHGFFGSKPYSRINEYLHELGQEAICWDGWTGAE